MQLQDLIAQIKESRAGRFLSEVQDAAAKEFAVGSEEVRNALFKARSDQDMSEEAPRFAQMKDAYRTPQAVKAALGFKEDPVYQAARNRAGIGFDVGTPAKAIGTGLGALGADLTQDRLRSFYWLLNAAQATGDMIAESAIARARPMELKDGTIPSGLPFGKYKGSDLFSLQEDASGKRRRKFGPGFVQLTAAPTGS